MTTEAAALSGRRRQAARNDTAILEAARDVFLADPKAPISAVAERAGVGISALYRRYANKEDLLRQLCRDGLRRYLAEAEQAEQEADDWAAFTTFVTGVVDADVHSLTVRLAGTFTPTPEMGEDAARAVAAATRLFDRAQTSGRLRPGVVVQDIDLILEACAAIRLPDVARTRELRRRYLAVMLDGLATVEAGAPPGPAPEPGELNWRWQRR
ncbi:helix-turn-helix domain-containing protein [Luedemannella helvata]|uniref:TetR/AcrR family transcriptional regulator n=1 Tax=Luedemannella helvata TaxID=349315 RepID=A0ABP4WGJ5_9ACTN